MSGGLQGGGISRRDGSPGDGIHLLWTPPYAAGYSVTGFDIQRRPAEPRPEPDCYSLTADDLTALHEDLRLDTPAGPLRVRAAPCPCFPVDPPDEPVGDPRPPPGSRICARLSDETPGEGPNPRRVGGFGFEVFDAAGSSLPRSAVRAVAGTAGLDCGRRLEVVLPAPAESVEVTLVRGADPVELAGLAPDGSVAVRAKAQAPLGSVETVVLRAAAIAHVVVEARQDETALIEVCAGERSGDGQPPDDGEPPDAGQASRLPQPAVDLCVDELGAPSARTAGIVTDPQAGAAALGLAYDIPLGAPHDFVSVEIGVPRTLAIALREGKAVASRLEASASGIQRVEFVGAGADRVLFYTTHAATSLAICLDPLQSPADEELEWSGVPYLVQNVQLPLRALDATLADESAEETLASSRLLGSETFDTSTFRTVADALAEAAAGAANCSPMWSTTFARERAEDPFLELRLWPYGLSLLVDAAWRRMLGFGYLDAAAGLTPGDTYDYRVSGSFPRRDLEEILYGFHTVPSGTTLPATFHLGRLALHSYVPARVEALPSPGGGALHAVARKGIALKPTGPGGRSLRISFPQPVTSAVLELEPSGQSLTYDAQVSLHVGGGGQSVSSGTVPSAPRVELSFSAPIQALTLRGSGFLYGVREVVSGGGSPDDLITRSVVLRGVRFEATSAPTPPPFVGTTNLQQAIAPTAPSKAASGAPQALGFRLSWLPPAPAGSPAPSPWPPDLASATPMDVTGFHLERRRVDVPDAYADLDGAQPPTLVLGNRGGRRDPMPLSWGSDVLAVFPEAPDPEPPVPVFMQLADVLVKAGAKSPPPPGSLHRYRIWSVDAIGRRSAAATVGSVVRLEKRLAPPQPAAPPAAAGDPPRPPGVRARLLQATDPDLPAADQALLGTSANAVVIEWGWTARERELDPYAKEFRVYWQPQPPDIVRGSFSGTAKSAGDGWELAATVDRPLAADAMKGAHLLAGGYPFKVASHGPGTALTVKLERSVLEPSRTPAPGPFSFQPTLDGSELRPKAWTERTATLPIAAAESYSHVLRDRLTLDADHPSARAWVGVSAADAETYVADERPAGSPHGGRPGNESSIAPVAVEGRYVGRPTFTVAPPLPNVPEQVCDEPVGDTVAAPLDLPALLPGAPLPAGGRVLVERLSFAALAALVSARTDGSIGINFPNGTSANYSLANATDHSAFRAQIASGMPGAVETRFLTDALLRYPAQLESLWRPALADPVAFAKVTDALPGKAERYSYRVRLVDAAGHVSLGAAIVPIVVRIPSLRTPGPPEIGIVAGATDAVTLRARVRDAFDLRSLLVFSLIADAATPVGSALREQPALLRLRNARKLAPNDGVRLRLGDGSVLAPIAHDLTAATSQPPDRLLSAQVTPGYDKRVAIWAATVTRDGIASRLCGPAVALTGARPLVAPALTVTATAGEDRASWGTLAVPAELSLDRTTDGGATWERVTPWLAPGRSSYTVPAPPPTARQYRVALRASRSRTATGTGVTPV